MKNETRKLFTAYLAAQATLNNVDRGDVMFAIAPSVQQTLETRIQESSDFLKSINVLPVEQLAGEKIGLGSNGPIASRTDTDQNPRQTRDVAALEGTGYVCAQTNYDTHIKYATLDAWAKFKDFQLRLSRVIQRQCALDRIMIGFNGTSVAATTKRAQNPLLQDVNKGWLQYLRENADHRIMDSGKTPNKVIVGNGNGADFKTLDGMVMDAAYSLLDPWHRQATDLVAIVGSDLLHDKLFPLVDRQTAPTEKLAADIVVSQARLGGKQAAAVPFMRPNSVLITSLDNLSIYYQEGARRRHLKEAPERNRIETYESSNDAFVVEDLGKCALVENIELI